MQFFSTVFVFLLPIFLLSFYNIGKNYKLILSNTLAVINLLMILYSFFLLKQFHFFYKLAEMMGVKVFPDVFIPITFQVVRIILIVIIPFLFLFKKFIANKILSIVYFVLLIWDFVKEKIYTSSSNSTIAIINFPTKNIAFYSMYYFSWMALFFALLWFLKRLPSQQNFSKNF